MSRKNTSYFVSHNYQPPIKTEEKTIKLSEGCSRNPRFDFFETSNDRFFQEHPIEPQKQITLSPKMEDNLPKERPKHFSSAQLAHSFPYFAKEDAEKFNENSSEVYGIAKYIFDKEKKINPPLFRNTTTGDFHQRKTISNFDPVVVASSSQYRGRGKKAPMKYSAKKESNHSTNKNARTLSPFKIPLQSTSHRNHGIQKIERKEKKNDEVRFLPKKYGSLMTTYSSSYIKKTKIDDYTNNEFKRKRLLTKEH